MIWPDDFQNASTPLLTYRPKCTPALLQANDAHRPGSITMEKKPKVPVTRRAVIARLNRKLAYENKILRGDRGASAWGQRGEFHVVDTKLNAVTARNVDVESLARKLGVLRDWEAMQ